MPLRFTLLVLFQITLLSLGFAQRGTVISFDLVETMTAQEIRDFYDSQNIPAFILNIEYGADTYKVKYETLDYDGLTPINATGIVIIPNDYPCDMALASFGHGLSLKNGEVPTGWDTNAYRLIALGFGGNGLVCTAPDYIRHGPDGEAGIQSFMHAKSEATATIDLMRAARNYCSENNIGLSTEVFVTGYSQGGHSSMATAKEIQENHPFEFDLKGVAPGGGTYDLSGIALDSLISPTRTTVEPHAFGLISRSYLDIYSDQLNIPYTYEELYKHPYDSILLEITDREHPNNNTSVLDPIPSRMLEDSILLQVRTDMNHPIRQALAFNNLYDWVPQMPMKIYHCGGDIENPMENAIFTYNEFVANGSTSVEFVVVDPDASHRDCAQLAILASKNWFTSIRQTCATAVNDLLVENGLGIHPNPFSSTAILDLSELRGGLHTVRIYDAMGRLKREFASTEASVRIERGDLVAGVYFVEVEGLVGRFAVQN